MKLPSTIILVLTLSSCASNSGVIPTGNGTFLITKQAATGFPGTGKIKANALKEANSHCRSLSKELEVTNLDENEGPYILGKYPRVELSFKCN